MMRNPCSTPPPFAPKLLCISLAGVFNLAGCAGVEFAVAFKNTRTPTPLAASIGAQPGPVFVTTPPPAERPAAAASAAK